MQTAEVEAVLAGRQIAAVSLKDATLAEAIDAVRSGLATGGGTLRIAHERRRHSEAEKLVNLQLTEVTVGEALERIGDQTARTVVVHHDGVVLRRTHSPAGTEEMVRRTYRVPNDVFTRARGGADPFGLEPETETEPLQTDQTDRELIADVLAEHGLPLPDGAIVHRNAANSTLTVESEIRYLDRIEAWLGDEVSGFRQIIRLQVEVYSVASALATDLQSAAGHASGGRAALKRIHAAQSRREASLIAAPSLATKSGQRAKVATGRRLRSPSGWQMKDGKTELVFDEEFAGCSLEFDPVLGTDGESVEVSLHLVIPLGEPEFRPAELTLPDGTAVSTSVPSTTAATMVTAISALSGQPLYLGALDACETGGVSLVAVATATVASIHPDMILPE